MNKLKLVLLVVCCSIFLSCVSKSNSNGKIKVTTILQIPTTTLINSEPQIQSIDEISNIVRVTLQKNDITISTKNITNSGTFSSLESGFYTFKICCSEKITSKSNQVTLNANSQESLTISLPGPYKTNSSPLQSLPLVCPSTFSIQSGSYLYYRLSSNTDILLRVFTPTGTEVLKTKFFAGATGAALGLNRLTINENTFNTELQKGLYYIELSQPDTSTLYGYTCFVIE